MASRELKIQEMLPTGLRPEFVAANPDGNHFQGGLNNFLVVENRGAVTRTVTIPHPQKSDGQDVDSITQAIAQDEMVYLGPFTAGWRGDKNEVQATYDNASGLYVAAITVYLGDYYA